MPSYLISGLHVSSELELPGAIPEPSQATATDISIRCGPVPTALDGATAIGPTWEMTEETFLLRVPRLARFQITAGRDVAVETEPGVTDRDAAGFVLGAAFCILLYQRGALVIHGAAVAKDGRAVAICGASGAGKSTLAAALCRGGCAFVADDISVVDLDASRQPMVLPDGRQLKLWKESINWLDLTQLRGEAVRESFEKYYIDPFDAHAQPSPLSAIYVLREAQPRLKAGIERLALPDAMRTLDYEAYRPGLRAKIGHKPETFARAAAMLGHTKMFLLIAPRGFEYLQETITELRAHWDSLDR
jgi:hypothetical protein